MSSSDNEEETKGDSGFGWLGMGVAALVGAGVAFMATRSTEERPYCNASSPQPRTGANSQSSEAYRNRPAPSVEPCGICLEDILVVVRLPCGHRFHEGCVMSWVTERKICPTCKRPVNLAQIQRSV